MSFDIVKTSLQQILPLRKLFLQENNFQIRYNACHERGWSESYLIIQDHQPEGYASVKGFRELKDRDAIFEFYLLPCGRNKATSVFEKLLQQTGVSFIECQSNEKVLTSLLYQFGSAITADVILFEDHGVTSMELPGAFFRKRRDSDTIFTHHHEGAGEYVLEIDHHIAATGGFLLHYNPPFADLYMEVEAAYRNKGLGSFLIQELKKACYNAGRIPAARCHITNEASRATLEKSGLRVAAYMMVAEVGLKKEAEKQKG